MHTYTQNSLHEKKNWNNSGGVSVCYWQKRIKWTSTKQTFIQKCFAMLETIVKCECFVFSKNCNVSFFIEANEPFGMILSTRFKMAFNLQHLCVIKFIMNPVRFFTKSNEQTKKLENTNAESNNLLQSSLSNDQANASLKITCRCHLSRPILNWPQFVIRCYGHCCASVMVLCVEKCALKICI